MSFPSLNSVGAFGSSGTGAGKRTAGRAVGLAPAETGAAVGARVSAMRVATGTVIVGSKVGIGTSVAIGFVGATVSGVGVDVGIGCLAQAAERTSTAKNSNRFIRTVCLTIPYLVCVPPNLLAYQIANLIIRGVVE